MHQHAWKVRTKAFAVDTLRFCERLPPPDAMRVAGRQLMRAASSVGANYRAACRGRSRSEVIAKLGIVEEEADEALYGFEVIEALDGRREVDTAELHRLHTEAGELLAIVVAPIRTARPNR